MNLCIYYLPLEEEIMNNVNFVQMKGPFSIFKKKILQFNKKFNIIKENQSSALSDEFNQLQAKTFNYFHQSNESNSLVALWDLVEEHGYCLISSIAKAAMALPTSSSDVEQLFSLVKQVKTLTRSSLSVDNLEGILLLSQEYKERSSGIITEDLICLFNSLKYKESKNEVAGYVRNHGEKKMTYEEKEKLANELMEIVEPIEENKSIDRICTKLRNGKKFFKHWLINLEEHEMLIEEIRETENLLDSNKSQRKRSHSDIQEDPLDPFLCDYLKKMKNNS